MMANKANHKATESKKPESKYKNFIFEPLYPFKDGKRE